MPARASGFKSRPRHRRATPTRGSIHVEVLVQKGVGSWPSDVLVGIIMLGMVGLITIAMLSMVVILPPRS